MAQPWVDIVVAEIPKTTAAFCACAALFGGLAFVLKGPAAFAGLRRLMSEVRISAAFAVINRLTVTPFMALAIGFIAARISPFGAPWSLLSRSTPNGDWLVLLAVILGGDFVGYWRHRLQHTSWLWPAHIVHHEDPRLCWFSQERMHPIDELGTLIDAFVLGLLGFPFWALAANTTVRHFWGYFIHSDLPWTLGPLGWVMNSPAMHRWHHAREVEGSGCNFATVFSFYDRLFGTYYLPRASDIVVGVDDDLGQGALGRLAHPFQVWRRAFKPAPARPDPSVA